VVKLGSSVAHLHEGVSSIDRPAWPLLLIFIGPMKTLEAWLGPYSRGFSWRVQQTRYKKVEEIASPIMGARKQYSSINFPAGFIKGLS